MIRVFFEVVSVVYLIAAAVHRQSAYESLARFQTESDAIECGKEIGIGTAEFVGIRQATAGSYAEIRFRYIVGKAGIAAGGGIQLSTQHDFRWDLWGGKMLQTRDPKGANVFTYGTSTGSPLRWEYIDGAQSCSLWQRMNQFIVTAGPLVEGETIELVFAIRHTDSRARSFSPSMRLRSNRKSTLIRMATAPFLPLGSSPSLKINAAATSSLKGVRVVKNSEKAISSPLWVN